MSKVALFVNKSGNTLMRSQLSSALSSNVTTVSCSLSLDKASLAAPGSLRNKGLARKKGQSPLLNFDVRKRERVRALKLVTSWPTFLKKLVHFFKTFDLRLTQFKDTLSFCKVLLLTFAL